MFTTTRLPAVFLAGLLASGAANAESVTYYLNQSNALPDGVNYLSVTIADGQNGSVDFTVQVLQPLLDIAGGNFGIDKFAFNVVGGTDTEAWDVTNLPDYWKASNGGRMDGFGLFDIKLKGRGNSRQDPTLTFSITGVDYDTILSYVDLSTGRSPEGHSFFSAHVAGFNWCDLVSPFSVTAAPHDWNADGDTGNQGDGGDWNDNGDCTGTAGCVTSAFFGGGTVVPAPPAVWLLGTGIAALLGRRFRKGVAQATTQAA